MVVTRSVYRGNKIADNKDNNNQDNNKGRHMGLTEGTVHIIFSALSVDFHAALKSECCLRICLRGMGRNDKIVDVILDTTCAVHMFCHYVHQILSCLHIKVYLHFSL